ncbi:MAG: hypothetical protein KZQ92_22545 [Candidatus Thiodiazotropha sp. (ex Lucinoma borealis)]|nr:hypothetical protein [Candidatus Thiodiazotropha sp. (ex Lucinoma borealis)]
MKLDITKFSEQICSKWLNDESEIEYQVVQDLGWRCILAPDIMNAMEAEWLAESAQILVGSNSIALNFEYGGVADAQFIDNTRDSFLGYQSKLNHNYIVITSPDERFLYYKDQLNRYFIICGERSFVKEAYRCSDDTSKLMYFDWVDQDFNNTAEKEYLTKIWTKYKLPGHQL